MVQPQKQLKYSFFLFGGGMLVLAVFVCLFFMTLDQTIASLARTYQFDPDVTETLSQSLRAALAVTLLGATILSLTTFALGIIMSHRVFGPMIPIKRQIEDLRQGRYSARGRLRQKDEFHDVMDALNDLAASLEEKQKNKQI